MWQDSLRIKKSCEFIGVGVGFMIGLILGFRLDQGHFLFFCRKPARGRG
jgi:hypothetical protein